MVAVKEQELTYAISRGDGLSEGQLRLDLSGVQSFIGNPARGLEHARRAGFVFKGLSINHKVVEALCMEASSLIELRRHSEALDVSQRALKLANELDLTDSIVYARGNLAKALCELGRLDEALLEYETCLEVMEERGQGNLSKALTLRGVAVVYLRKGDRVTALEKMKSAAAQAALAEETDHFVMINNEIAMIAAGRNPFVKPSGCSGAAAMVSIALGLLPQILGGF